LLRRCREVMRSSYGVLAQLLHTFYEVGRDFWDVIRG
jgi:hypothetical protein